MYIYTYICVYIYVYIYILYISIYINTPTHIKTSGSSELQGQEEAASTCLRRLLAFVTEMSAKTGGLAGT